MQLVALRAASFMISSVALPLAASLQVVREHPRSPPPLVAASTAQLPCRLRGAR